jgi:hypothetical protein
MHLEEFVSLVSLVSLVLNLWSSRSFVDRFVGRPSDHARSLPTRTHLVRLEHTADTRFFSSKLRELRDEMTPSRERTITRKVERSGLDVTRRVEASAALFVNPTTSANQSGAAKSWRKG